LQVVVTGLLGGVVTLLAHVACLAWLAQVHQAMLALRWGWPLGACCDLTGGVFDGWLCWRFGCGRRARSVAARSRRQARLAELQARIRPHFLFNTLNTAIALVQVDPPSS
jgi:two-component system sensor histidine kinase AlgZ